MAKMILAKFGLLANTKIEEICILANVKVINVSALTDDSIYINLFC